MPRDDIAARLRAATPGPWYWAKDWETVTEEDKYASLQLFGPDERPGTPSEIIPLRRDHYEHIWDVGKCPPELPTRGDRELIAHAPSDIAWLLERADALASLLGEVEERMQNGRAYVNLPMHRRILGALAAYRGTR